MVSSLANNIDGVDEGDFGSDRILLGESITVPKEKLAAGMQLSVVYADDDHRKKGLDTPSSEQNVQSLAEKTRDYHKAFVIRKNNPEYPHELTFRIIQSNGDENLLPIPPDDGKPLKCLINVDPEYSISLQLNHDGSLKITNVNSTVDIHYRISEFEPEDTDPDFRMNGSKVLGEVPVGLNMSNDSYYNFYGDKDELLGGVFMLPNSEGMYVFKSRANNSEVLIDAKKNVYSEVELGDGNKLLFTFREGALLVSGPSTIKMEMVVFNGTQQISAGESGVIKGLINGGHSIAASSYWKLSYHRKEDEILKRRLIEEELAGKDGISTEKIDAIVEKVKSDGQKIDVNEDNVGFSSETGTGVVADGISAGRNGEQASASCVRTLLHHTGSLREAVIAAHEENMRLNLFLVRFFGSAARSDTVFTAFRFKGRNKLDLAGTGDCRWHIVHEGKIIASSTERGTISDMLRVGMITLREAYTDPDYLRLLSQITSTVGNINPDEIRKNVVKPENASCEVRENVDFPKGARLVLLSDGAKNLTPEQIVQCTDGQSTTDAEMQLRRMVEICNEEGAYYADMNDGGEKVFMHAPWDNCAIMVVEND